MGGGAFLENSIWGGAPNFGAGNIIISVGLAVSSIACWFLHKSLMQKGTKILLDKETGEDVLFKPSHTLFFIPMHWWGVIGGVVSSFVLFDGIKKTS